MSSADVYGSVLAGHRFVLILCDNEGYAVIDRLQVFTGGASFNNMLEDVRAERPARVDFAKHAEAMGAWTETVDDLDGLEGALERACAADRTAVIVIRTDPHTWTGGDAWWDVGVPEVSDRGARGQGRPRSRPEAPEARGVSPRAAGGDGRGSRRRHPTIVDVADRPASRSPSCRAPGRAERQRREARGRDEGRGRDRLPAERGRAEPRPPPQLPDRRDGLGPAQPLLHRGDRRDPGGGPWLRVPRSVQHRWPRRRRGGRGVGHPPATPDRRHRDGRPGALIAGSPRWPRPSRSWWSRSTPGRRRTTRSRTTIGWARGSPSIISSLWGIGASRTWMEAGAPAPRSAAPGSSTRWVDTGCDRRRGSSPERSPRRRTRRRDHVVGRPTGRHRRLRRQRPRRGRALDAFDDHGLHVPADMSLVGYDNIALAGLGHIDLTTIDQPRRDMGVTAVRLLLERRDEDRRSARHLVVPPSLVVRGSTGPPAGTRSV